MQKCDLGFVPQIKICWIIRCTWKLHLNLNEGVAPQLLKWGAVLHQNLKIPELGLHHNVLTLFSSSCFIKMLGFLLPRLIAISISYLLYLSLLFNILLLNKINLIAYLFLNSGSLPPLSSWLRSFLSMDNLHDRLAFLTAVLVLINKMDKQQQWTMMNRMLLFGEAHIYIESYITFRLFRPNCLTDWSF